MEHCTIERLADQATVARAPMTMVRKLDQMMLEARRNAGPDVFKRAGFVMDPHALTRLLSEVRPGSKFVSLRDSLTGDGEYCGVPIEVVTDRLGVGLALPGDMGSWPLFVAAQGKRLAQLALTRFPTTSGPARRFMLDDRGQPEIEVAMVKIAARIAMG